jgi:hypothetical protein
MPIWTWFLIAAMLVVAAVVFGAVIALGRRRRSARLKERFGPEYERTVSAAGNQRAAEKELTERERTHNKLDIRALSSAERDGFAGRWQNVQTAFVDDPPGALGDADRLLTEVMRARGYPVDDFDRRAADISVDHPTVVENYRAAHAIHVAQQHGDIGTEAHRQAFVHYRALFEKLLETDTDEDALPHHTGTPLPDTGTAKEAKA